MATFKINVLTTEQCSVNTLGAIKNKLGYIVIIEMYCKTKKYLGLASSCAIRLATSKLAGEIGRSRSKLKSILSKSGRFLLLLPDRALRAHERSKLPYDDVFRSRKLFSLADDRKKSIKLLSSSSLSTRLRRRRKLPVGVTSIFMEKVIRKI